MIIAEMLYHKKLISAFAVGNSARGIGVVDPVAERGRCGVIFVKGMVTGVNFWGGHFVFLFVLTGEGECMSVFEIERRQLELLFALPLTQTYDVF